MFPVAPLASVPFGQQDPSEADEAIVSSEDEDMLLVKQVVINTGNQYMYTYI